MWYISNSPLALKYFYTKYAALLCKHLHSAHIIDAVYTQRCRGTRFQKVCLECMFKDRSSGVKLGAVSGTSKAASPLQCLDCRRRRDFGEQVTGGSTNRALLLVKQRWHLTWWPRRLQDLSREVTAAIWNAICSEKGLCKTLHASAENPPCWCQCCYRATEGFVPFAMLSINSPWCPIKYMFWPNYAHFCTRQTASNILCFLFLATFASKTSPVNELKLSPNEN